MPFNLENKQQKIENIYLFYSVCCLVIYFQNCRVELNCRKEK